MSKLRIAIATSGRFHVVDLARELVALGYDVRLYSMLPDAQVEYFGLHRRHHRSLFVYTAPLIAWQRFASRTLSELQNSLLSRVLDRVVASVIEPCDVLICMSGIFVRSIETAKRKYGAHVWLERGSRHILSQAEILGEAGARVPTPEIIRREMDGYRLADRIVVPARHVAESFERDPQAHAKLFVNPYGTKLDMFPYRERTAHGAELRLVFAGAWSLRKGCDVLAATVRECRDVRLLHVGPVVDPPFPTSDARFRHVDPVPQNELCRYYHESDVFVHASREEGLSVVQAQALASGLPLICTDRTGGEDLGHTPALRDRIVVVPSNSCAALLAAIEGHRWRLAQGPPFAELGDNDREALGWPEYARRYAGELSRRCAGGKR
jgi:starch synthase